jgi:dicarboxylate transporter 10
MTYSICRFWAYDQSKKLIGADAKSPAWKLAIAGSMGKRSLVVALSIRLLMITTAGGIAGMVGNPGEIMMVRMQADMAKPPEKRLNYKHSIDGLIRVSLISAVAGFFS